MADQEESGFNQRVLVRRAGQVFWAQNLATVAELKAVGVDLRRQLQMCFVLETNRIYYYDANSTDTADNDRVVTPTDATGRWLGFGVLSGNGVFIQSSQPTIGEGRIWYDTVNKIWRGCNGTDYNTILGGSSV